jgi:triphosphatase
MRGKLELKVELSDVDARRFGNRSRYNEPATEPVADSTLRAVYFDTPKHNLHAAGLSLQLRRQQGRWLQMVTADRRVGVDTSDVIEFENPVESEEPDLTKIPDKRIKRAVQKAVAGTSLHPVFETAIQWTTRKTKGNEKALLVNDGHVRLGAASSEHGTAELELKASCARDLLFAVEKLLGGHDLRLTGHERGYHVAVGKRAAAKPEKAQLAHITRKNSCASAFCAILASTARQIVINRHAVLQTDDPEGAHQMRIGLRRLRSALRALRPLSDVGSLRAFERSARDVGRRVGMLRDADVLISGIQTPIEQVAPDKRGFSELRDALARDRRTKRSEARTALRGPAWTRLQLYLALWPRTLAETNGLDRRITKHARRVLRKAWRKAAKLGANLNRLDAERRHEMRKALKELRYQTEFFAPLFKRRDTRHFIEQLKALQDVFGYINDVRMAPRLLEVLQERQTDANAALAASYTVGRHEAEAAHVWGSAEKLWKALRRSPHFWT